MQSISLHCVLFLSNCFIKNCNSIKPSNILFRNKNLEILLYCIVCNVRNFQSFRCIKGRVSSRWCSIKSSTSDYNTFLSYNSIISKNLESSRCTLRFVYCGVIKIPCSCIDICKTTRYNCIVLYPIKFIQARMPITSRYSTIQGVYCSNTIIMLLKCNLVFNTIKVLMYCSHQSIVNCLNIRIECLQITVYCTVKTLLNYLYCCIRICEQLLSRFLIGNNSVSIIFNIL